MWRTLAIAAITVTLLGSLFVANAAGPVGVWSNNGATAQAFGHLPQNE